jgi:hypothetical protein
VVEVTDEDEAPATADDPRNYDYEGEDTRMSSLEPPIAADPRNYDPELEPVPDAVPVEQQASSSRMMLDNPTPQNARFLGFCPCPAAEIASASRASLVEEILQQSAEDVEGEEQLESALLKMSEVFGQAGRLLGQRRQGGKGRVAHRSTPTTYIFFCIFIFISKSSEKRSVAPFGVPRLSFH